MKKSELVAYLDSYLESKKFTDGSKNGLQVDTFRKDIWKIGYAVDASSYIFDKAIAEGVDFLIVHHGLFWGYESVVTGVLHERLSKLLKNDIALYGMHLPLDAHKTVGNNIGIIEAFIRFFNIPDAKIEAFGEYRGEIIGFGARFPKDIPVKRLKEFSDSMGFVFDFYNFGNLSKIQSLAVISGGGGEDVAEANRKGYDVFLTGEGAHHQHVLAKELRQSVLFWGHYETETIGVALLAKHLSETFSVQTVFLDEKY